MHNFSMLKWGGQHLTLLRRIAQKAVRHDTQSDCRRAEEVQDNNEIISSDGCSRFSVSRRFRFNHNGHIFVRDSRRFQRGRSPKTIRQNLYLCSSRCGFLFLLRHACGGRNHLLTEVAA